jgi:hypothetical protein
MTDCCIIKSGDESTPLGLLKESITGCPVLLLHPKVASSTTLMHLDLEKGCISDGLSRADAFVPSPISSYPEIQSPSISNPILSRLRCSASKLALARRPIVIASPLGPLRTLGSVAIRRTARVLFESGPRSAFNRRLSEKWRAASNTNAHRVPVGVVRYEMFWLGDTDDVGPH